jgi:hypothetical protein
MMYVHGIHNISGFSFQMPWMKRVGSAQPLAIEWNNNSLQILNFSFMAEVGGRTQISHV